MTNFELIMHACPSKLKQTYCLLRGNSIHLIHRRSRRIYELDFYENLANQPALVGICSWQSICKRKQDCDSSLKMILYLDKFLLDTLENFLFFCGLKPTHLCFQGVQGWQRIWGSHFLKSRFVRAQVCVQRNLICLYQPPSRPSIFLSESHGCRYSLSRAMAFPCYCCMWLLCKNISSLCLGFGVIPQKLQCVELIQFINFTVNLNTVYCQEIYNLILQYTSSIW